MLRAYSKTDGAEVGAVYIPAAQSGSPMSYQVGGYTVIVPRAQVTPIGMARDEAMRFVLTAGLTAQDRKLLLGGR